MQLSVGITIHLPFIETIMNKVEINPCYKITSGVRLDCLASLIHLLGSMVEIPVLRVKV